MIFISYRRSDSQMVAGRLRESLARRLGDKWIFRDKNSIGAGEDWTQAIEDNLTKDTTVLALIGPGWVGACNEKGERRLEDPSDWNRLELELALKRSAKVIPLLIDQTSMPREAELPTSLRQLVHINALKLRDDDWETDVQRLIETIGHHGQSSWLRRPLAIALTIAAAVAISIAGYFRWIPVPPGPVETDPNLSENGDYLADIREKLRKEQEKGLELLFSRNVDERARAIQLIDSNLGNINKALRSFPNDVYLHSLAGYAAKNVYASSGGTNLLTAEQRKKYLAQARRHFEMALKINPKDARATNGMGNVLFYEGNLNAAIRKHEEAIKLAGGSYPSAEHDLQLVQRVKSGSLPFPE